MEPDRASVSEPSPTPAPEPEPAPAAAPEPEPAPEPAPALDLSSSGVDLSDPNAKMSADDIAALFAAANGGGAAAPAPEPEPAPAATPDPEPAPAPEPEPAPAPTEPKEIDLSGAGVDLSDPNKQLSPACSNHYYLPKQLSEMAAAFLVILLPLPAGRVGAETGKRRNFRISRIFFSIPAAPTWSPSYEKEKFPHSKKIFLHSGGVHLEPKP